MKQFAFIIALCALHLVHAEAQVVKDIKSSRLKNNAIDVGISIGYYPIFKSAHVAYDSIYTYDKYGNSNIVTFFNNTVTFGVPISLNYGMFYAFVEPGFRLLSYTPRSVDISTAYAKQRTTFPNSRRYGYADSFWFSNSVSFGVSSIQIGLTLDTFLLNHSVDNRYYHFLNIGDNSYSDNVLTIFANFSLDTPHMRLSARIGIQERGYLDGVHSFKTTGHSQNHFETGPGFSLGLVIEYKIFASYGKYRNWKL